MSDKYESMKNADLKEYCENEGIDVDSKNVSKPTRKEYIASIEAFESGMGEKVITEEFETIADDDDFTKEVAMVKAEDTKIEGDNDGLQKEDKAKKVISRREKKRAQEKEVMALKRVIITSNSTNQTKTGGIERISWGNRLVGHQTDNVVIGKPWHVREGALRNMRGATIRQSIEEDDMAIGSKVKFETIPAWVIQYLDPLTKEEIIKIGKRQTIRDASIDSLT